MCITMKDCQTSCFRAEEKIKGDVLRLGCINQAKAEDAGKRGRQTVDRHFE